MTIADRFQSFIKEIQIDVGEVLTTCKEITKKLNVHYYDLSGDDRSHFYFVGSIGRQTAVKNTSDVDIIFDLPTEIYQRFDAYESNGQSALLQEVKDVLQERYTKTKISGDGQVVVIEFEKYTVELVPAFLRKDNTFIYPDTHDGGSWKKTDPFSEQKATQEYNELSKGVFGDVCRMVREWKNTNGVVLGGLLIDTLCYKLFSANDVYSQSGFEDYYSIMIDVFEFLKDLSKEQSFWFALGSNQKVYSKDNSFILKAREAYDKMTVAVGENEKQDALVELFGYRFPQEETRYSLGNDTEEYIEELFPVDIKYNLVIDCTVSQNGFRTFNLRHMLRQGIILRHNKQLQFSIEKCSAPEPYDIYWKVRNVGPLAFQKNLIRGQVIKTNCKTHRENTCFQGPHFVECFIVKNHVCVAKDRIDVPIGSC